MESSYLMLLHFSRKNKKKQTVVTKEKKINFEDIYRSSDEVTVVTNPLPKFLR